MKSNKMIRFVLTAENFLHQFAVQTAEKQVEPPAGAEKVPGIVY